jgi:hypothetical protein
LYRGAGIILTGTRGTLRVCGRNQAADAALFNITRFIVGTTFGLNRVAVLPLESSASSRIHEERDLKLSRFRIAPPLER